MFAQDEYAMNQKNFYGFEVRMTNNNFDEVGSKFSQNRPALVFIQYFDDIDSSKNNRFDFYNEINSEKSYHLARKDFYGL